MKKLFLILLSCCLSYLGHAQTAKEWVQQKKTQIEYLVNQVIGLRAYANVVNKGFQTAKEGLAVINGIKKGDFSIHENHIQSLRSVSPAVRSSPDLNKAVTAWQGIQSAINRIKKLCNLENGLTDAEKVYVKGVLTNLKKLSTEAMEDIEQLAQGGQLSLSDDERLEKMASHRANLEDQHLFLQSLEKWIKLLAISRLKERNDVNVLKKLYGIQ